MTHSSIIRYLPKRNMPKNLLKNVPSSFIHSVQTGNSSGGHQQDEQLDTVV